MARQIKAQRQVDGVGYAYARCYRDFPYGKSVVAKLQGRRWIQEIHAIVGWAGESEREAKAAGAGGESPDACAGRDAAIFSHPGDAEIAYGLESAKQNAPGSSYRLAGYIHAEVSAVYGVYICVAGGSEDHLVSRSWAAMRMRRGIGRVVVRTEIGFYFNDPAENRAFAGAANEEFPEQPGSHVRGMKLKE